MTIFKRLLYFFYYLKKSDWKLLGRFLGYASEKSGRSRPCIIFDSIFSVFRYNISFKDYYCFRFYDKPRSEREEWAGTGFMYEYQLRMNPKGSRELLENKVQFLNHYKLLVKRMFLHISGFSSDSVELNEMLRKSERLVLKGSRGQVGKEVEVISSGTYTPQKLGLLCHNGWLAYLNENTLFIKYSPKQSEMTYPDLGSNLEVYVDHKILELETLSPLVEIFPGKSISHKEVWILKKMAPDQLEPEAIFEVVSELVSTLITEL